MDNLTDLLVAIHFAAQKHRDHRRKDLEASPYINHPIEVAEVLARVAGITELAILQTAILHDTVEDTETTVEELELIFGAEVSRMVAEVTDDKSLAKQERKRLQVEHAPALSHGAKLVKIADKICNVRDIAYSAPQGWSDERRLEYFSWAAEVVAGCRGVSKPLEHHFDACVADAARVVGHA